MIEAGREATRRVDGEELRVKGEELHIRAENARAEAENVLARLSRVRYGRLRLVITSSSVEFCSDDAVRFLNGINSLTNPTPSPPMDRVALMQSMMTFVHPVGRDIVAFAHAESERDARLLEKTEVERTSKVRRRALAEAEDDVRFAMEVRTWIHINANASRFSPPT